MEHQRSFHHTLLMVLVCILPLFLFFVLMLSGIAISPLFFLLFLIICCGAMFYFMGGARAEEEAEGVIIEESQEDTNTDITLASKAQDVFKLRSRHKAAMNLVAEGKLLVDPDSAYIVGPSSRFLRSFITLLPRSSIR